jgi:hypothetical protein
MTIANSRKISEGKESLDFQRLKVTGSFAHTQQRQSLSPEFITT